MPHRLRPCFLLPLALAACSAPPGARPPQAPANAAGPTGSGSAAIAGSDSAAGISATAADMQRYRSDRYGFRIDYPADWTAQRDFDHGYLANGAWKTYAPAGSVGTPVLALVMPHSNDVTAAELRIGVSSDADAVQHCSEPSGAVRGAVGHATLAGTRFTRFEAADAAMSHYLTVHSYRAVHDGRCYAIDLLVTGTNPQVYDPPATPPFSRDQAFARLHAVLQGFRFTP
ncbi:MAG TPA: hypothetical protein VFG73_03375 [Rhodanobacteraceae bacterium]|nr:hypothetical protein [Rhodanobacteraceae bacterium]